MPRWSGRWQALFEQEESFSTGPKLGVNFVQASASSTTLELPATSSSLVVGQDLAKYGIAGVVWNCVRSIALDPLSIAIADHPIDVVVASDCLYESASHSALLSTLLELTDQSVERRQHIIVLLAYQQRLPRCVLHGGCSPLGDVSLTVAALTARRSSSSRQPPTTSTSLSTPRTLVLQVPATTLAVPSTITARASTSASSSAFAAAS
ncbi:unnamed protein product [Phytophthora lilii]|uniref:Unnamed protein product n=1 Tax=Phytophthora lilii TaxID=2077276 RepID=A0A9W6XBY8_9STRA|nr:unnamed protein product [Phytophthora lilii]